MGNAIKNQCLRRLHQALRMLHGGLEVITFHTVIGIEDRLRGVLGAFTAIFCNLLASATIHISRKTPLKLLPMNMSVKYQIVIEIMLIVMNQRSSTSLVEFYQHVVFAYAENFLSLLDIFDLLNLNLNDTSAYMFERSEIWVKNAYFWLKKTCFLDVSKLFFLHFSLSIGIDKNFLIKIFGDSTT